MAARREPDLLEQLTTDHEVLRVRFSELGGCRWATPGAAGWRRSPQTPWCGT
ncbi:hypothetical protein ACFQ2M_03365 [Kitasatospora saccharophila]|uniref:hypothetical protein n=1 Tax=Kitasatospora saccharophila TaxID=407973 RepID=UPI00362D6F16